MIYIYHINLGRSIQNVSMPSLYSAWLPNTPKEKEKNIFFDMYSKNDTKIPILNKEALLRAAIYCCFIMITAHFQLGLESTHATQLK